MGVVPESTMASLAGDFPQDLDRDQPFDQLIGGRIGSAGQIAYLIHGNNRALIEMFEYTVSIAR
jgi:hypothetical protein